jgi:hypothetical protein
MKLPSLVASTIFALGLMTSFRADAVTPVSPRVVAGSDADAGRYIVLATGCNHCHTAGWADTNGKVAQAKWLLGGTAPPNVPAPNLRIIAGAIAQAQFVRMFRVKQPPSAMPWYDVGNLTDKDLGAVYTFIRSLK